MVFEPPLRLATREDGWALADLANSAGEGLPMVIWRRLAAPGESPLAVGAHRQAERAERGEVVVVDEGRGVDAAMIGHPAGEMPGRYGALSDQLAPIDQLEALMPDTWLMVGLATYPAARGRGLGARLVKCAERIAQEAGLSGVSIIVTDTNVSALRLYQRLGYREAGRARVIPDGWDTDAAHWLLVTKPL